MDYLKLAASGLCALGLAACGSSPYYADAPSSSYRSNGSDYRSNGSSYSEYGRVVGIETVGTNGNGGTTGAGAVIGGVVGGVLGHQIGSGRGNDAATVVGAIGGAVVGNEMERRRGSGDYAYRVDVRVENGAIRSMMHSDIGDLRVGDRVRIDGDRVSRY